MEENNKENEHSMSDLENLSNRIARRAESLGRSHAFNDVYRIVWEQSQKTFAKFNKSRIKNLDFAKDNDVVTAYENMHRFEGMDKAYNEILDFLKSKLDESINDFDKTP